uniref:Uncharacterized protein n=1 Tax=Acrobeloides nanus TaxID=290746 RepID=A0A914CNX8_9BILA
MVLPVGHKANETQEMLLEERPDFIMKDEWPPNSPHLKPLDYAILDSDSESDSESGFWIRKLDAESGFWILNQDSGFGF